MTTIILEPHQTDKAKARLDWLRDNNPDFLMESYKEGTTLKRHVTNILTWAMETAIQLRKNGTEEQIITEVMFSIVAPADNLDIDRKVTQIPERKYQEIVDEIMT